MKFSKRLFNRGSLALLGAAALPWSGQARADGSPKDIREIEIIVQGGYKPNRIDVVEGQSVRLKFVRKEASGCSREVVFPALGIRKELPQNEPVVIPLPPLKAGEYGFECGMKMLTGKLVVRPRK
jgi:plastocyanin domain-containing protein